MQSDVGQGPEGWQSQPIHEGPDSSQSGRSFMDGGGDEVWRNWEAGWQQGDPDMLKAMWWSGTSTTGMW